MGGARPPKDTRMSATWTPTCTTERWPSPPSEPMGVWLSCEHGLRTTVKRTLAEALAELDRMHRQGAAA